MYKSTKKLTNEERNLLLKRYVSNLRKANKYDLVVLRHTKSELSRDDLKAYQMFHRYLPKDLYYSLNEEIYYLVAILFAINPNDLLGEDTKYKSFGTSMAMLNPSREKLFSRILSSPFDKVGEYRDGGGELATLLRRAFHIMSKGAIGVDYTRLCKDLCYWSHPDKFVQKQWVRDYSFKVYKNNGES